MQEVFAWAEEMWLHHGLYSQAIRKAVRYFMTEIEIEGDELDANTREKYSAALSENYDILQTAAAIGDDYMAFGNSFTSHHVPFTRHLVCPKCGMSAPLKKMKDFIKYEKLEFKGRCPASKCGHVGRFHRKDIPKPEEGAKPNVIRWPPQYMELKQHPLSGNTYYSLDVLKYDVLREGVLTGDIMYIEETPWEILEAVEKNQKFEFDEDQIYHMAYPSISCCIPALKGWGIPPFMAEFETALLVHMLDKYTEAFLVDYLVPFRVLTPPPGRGDPEGDVMLQVNMGTFVGQVRRMIDKHRRNPAGWNFLPFPLQYQALGAEAKDLAPIEIQEHFEMRLLHSMGIPPEFYKGGTASGATRNNASPMLSFKMFEREWQFFANELNKWFTWLAGKHGEYMNWEKVTAKLVPVALFEDPEIRDIKLQLAASNEISRTTAYRPLGIDMKAERAKIIEEEDEFMQEQAKREKEIAKREGNSAVAQTPGPGQTILAKQEAAMAAQGGGGGMPMPGGAPVSPMAGGGGIDPAMLQQQPQSIEELVQQAEMLASQILTMDSMARKSTLNSIKKSNEVLHAQVTSILQSMEQQAGQQGVAMARQGQMPPQ
jgi:hypothetical protein